jgi:hypothetical protein
MPDITREATSRDGAAVDFTLPAASDAVTDTPIVTCTRASGTTFAIGSTTVNCTATDGAGNRNSTSFVVSVGELRLP